jgi:hypothetical protein
MFILYKEKLKLDKNFELPAALQEIIDNTDKDEGIKWALYVFLLADRTDDNPMKDIPTDKRAALAKKIAFGSTKPQDSDENSILAVKAIKEYKEDHFDKTQSDVDLYDKKMFELMSLLTKTEPKILKNTHAVSGKISYTTNIDIITTILENVIKIIIDKATMVGLQKTGNSVTALRGGLSPNSKGKLSKF